MFNTKTIAVIVLAGGKGTRLRHVTGPDAQKVLHFVAGKPLIQHTTDLLDASIIERIVFNVGYRAQEVCDWVQKQQFNFRFMNISVQQEWTFVDAVMRAFAATKEDLILICNADEIRDGVVLEDAINFHLKQKSLVTLVGAVKQQPERYRILHLNEYGLLKKSVYCPEPSSEDAGANWVVNAGIAILERDAFEYFDTSDRTGGWDAMLNPLTIANQIHVFVSPNIKYFNVGTPEELADAEAYYLG